MIDEILQDGRRAAWCPSREAYPHTGYHVFRPGLAINTTDNRVGGVPERRFLLPAGLSLSITVAGSNTISLGGKSIRYGGDGISCDAALVRIAEPSLAVRHKQAGDHLFQLTILAAAPWLDEDLAERLLLSFPALRHRHGLVHRWEASPRTRLLAQSLLRAKNISDGWRSLLYESHAVELLSAVAQALGGSPSSGRVVDLPKVHRLRDLIDVCAGAPPSLSELARQSGMAITTMQRQFRVAFGTSVGVYLRERTMQRARRILESGAPVSVAANAAGYQSSANFSTAFKRHFGISPKRLRARVLD